MCMSVTYDLLILTIILQGFLSRIFDAGSLFAHDTNSAHASYQSSIQSCRSPIKVKPIKSKGTGMRENSPSIPHQFEFYFQRRKIVELFVCVSAEKIKL